MSARMHEVHRALAAGAAVMALLAAITGTPVPVRVTSPNLGDGALASGGVARTVDALQLAAWIREGARDLRVLDLRDRSTYEYAHVPSAEAADFARLDTLARREDAPVVVYSDDDVRDAQAWANLAARGHRRAYVLEGGMEAWSRAVMDPVLRGDSADYVAALSRYFGGVPRAPRPGEASTAPAPARLSPLPDPTSRSAPSVAATSEFGETPRRGC
jgi:rhodanese-related sulfurtransferase